MSAILWLTLMTVVAPTHKETFDRVSSTVSSAAWYFSYEREREVARVYRAMELVAQTTWPRDLNKMMSKWADGSDPTQMADAIVLAAHRNDVDPLLLVSIAWKESHFQRSAKGDKRAGMPRSCGPTQIRVDIRGRPSCDAFMDPYFAFDWTSQFLLTFPRSGGKINMTPYNGAKAGQAFWDLVSWMDKRLAREQPLRLASLYSHSWDVE